MTKGQIIELAQQLFPGVGEAKTWEPFVDYLTNVAGVSITKAEFSSSFSGEPITVTISRVA